MAATLVTLAQAKVQLRIPAADTDSDADVQAHLDHAEAAILDYLNATAWWRAVTVVWTAGTVPGQVTAAILLLTGHLYAHRGDDFETSTSADLAVWQAIERLLARTRDPVLA
jgi:hypothetical protein